MNGKLRSTLIAAAALLAATAFTACEGVWDFTGTVTITKPDPKGKVVNVKTGTGLADASVSMTYISGAADKDKPAVPYTAKTNASGEYSLNDVVPGEYQLTATKSGYGFTKEIVNVTGAGYTLPDIGGFQPGADDVLTIFVLWDKSFKDVDAHLTYPNKDVTLAKNAPVLAGISYYNFYEAATDGVSDSGFFPDTATNRTDIYWNNKKGVVDPFYGVPSVELDIDNTGAAGQNPGGPETMTFRYFPITDDANNVSYTSKGSGDPSALPSGTYTWLGVMEYYLHAYTDGTSLSTEGSPNSADAVVYVFSKTAQVGVYRIPTFTNVKAASVLRINMLRNSAGTEEYFQILPDIRTTGLMRGLEDGGIVVVKGIR